MKDGHSYREHCEAAAKAHNAKAKAELQGPELPAACAYVWTWFLELHQARSFHQFGSNPIGYAELQAWAGLTGRRLQPWEVAALRALDRAWLTEPDMGEGAQ